MSTAIETWLAEVPEAQRETLTALHHLVLNAVPDATGAIKWKRPCYSVGGKLFCYLAHAKNHVTLGFQDGASLSDPTGLLEGTGKDMRHVKVQDPSAPALAALVAQAAERAR